MNRLNQLISALADRPFDHVQTLRGSYDFPGFNFRLIKIQRSAGAHPASIASVTVSRQDSAVPEVFLQTEDGRLAVADFLIRRFRQGIDMFALQNRGKEGSGSFDTIELSQKMLERDSVLINQAAIELRFMISWPARGQGGGVFDAEQARIMINQELPAIIDATFFYERYDEQTKTQLEQFVDVLTTRTRLADLWTSIGWSLLSPTAPGCRATAASTTGRPRARLLSPFNRPIPSRLKSRYRMAAA